LSIPIKTPAISNKPATDPRAAGSAASSPDGERAVLVHVHFPGAEDAGALEELELLAQSAGAVVCAEVTGRRRAPEAATYIGKGKAEEVREAVERHGAELVLINHAISPVQERNLERAFKCRVLDRTGLILDIFAQRASSHEGKLQVELAQLKHLSTRLVRGWTHLERQKGGIGLRGPGETQLETDRRLIGERIKALHRRLQKVRAQRAHRRRARGKVPVPTISLVGYTNAGKSSLFNRLTQAGVYQADQLFATLDPTMRRLAIPHCGNIVLTDTVGFIRQLPHGLIESFRSTLEEVSGASLLLHVVDAADPRWREYVEQVDEVLKEIGAETVPRILVFNKIDRLDRSAGVACNTQGEIDRVWVSARRGDGIELLLEAISEHFRRDRIRRFLRVPPAAGDVRAKLYRRMDILHEAVSESGDWLIEVEFAPAELAWLEAQAARGVEITQAEDGPVLARCGSAP
jgi:GTP-binding protein HflX